MFGIDDAIVGGIASGVISGAAGLASSKGVNDTNIELANTKYQRGVRDLKAAGLNPILAATGGSSAAAAVPQIVNPTKSAVEMGTGVLNSALAVRGSNIKKDLAESTVKLADADVVNKEEQNNLLKMQQAKTAADTLVSTNSAAKIAQDTKRDASKTDLIDMGYSGIKMLIESIFGDDPVSSARDVISKPSKPKTSQPKQKIKFADERPHIWERDYKQRMKTYNYIQGLRQ